MLEVITPAATQDLVTLAEVKAYFDITGTTQDAKLQLQISKVSEDISDFLNRVLVVETVEEVLDIPRQAKRLITLERWPVISVISVEEAGVALGSTGWRCYVRNGLLERRESQEFSTWGSPVTVRYQAGFVTMPAWAKAAAYELISWEESKEGREFGVKSERLDGLAQVTYFDNEGLGSSGLPKGVESRLTRHRNVNL